MNVLASFVYLQVLDMLTTVAFMLYGVDEVNPVIRWAMRESFNPLGGLLLVKIFAVFLAVYCAYGARMKLLRKVNLFFAAVIVHNVVALIMAAPVLH